MYPVYVPNGLSFVSTHRNTYFFSDKLQCNVCLVQTNPKIKDKLMLYTQKKWHVKTKWKDEHQWDLTRDIPNTQKLYPKTYFINFSDFDGFHWFL